MSRHNYDDDLDQRDLAMWRGQVASAMRGKRGQRFLRDLIAALDAMPEKWLGGESLITDTDEVCAMGCVAQARGIDISDLATSEAWEADLEQTEAVAKRLDIAEQLAREVAYVNDGWFHETGEQRWARVRKWAVKHLRVENEQP